GFRDPAAHSQIQKELKMTTPNRNRLAGMFARLHAGLWRRIAIATVSLTCFSNHSVAQVGVPCLTAQTGKVGCLFPQVIGRAAQTARPWYQLDPGIPLGTSVISTQMTSALPMPAPASGYVYQYDPNLGTARAERQSYGPIFAERAETIGRHKFSFGFSSQTF